MQLSVENNGRPVTWRPEVPARGRENRFWVFNRAGPAVPALRHARAPARPGRRQPPHVLVPGVPVVTARRADHLPPIRRVGHKGADHVAPGNTFESFQAALDLRVDMIEFDVLRLKDGRLVLAHDPEDAHGRTPHTLDEGLDHFADEAYAGRRA